MLLVLYGYAFVTALKGFEDNLNGVLFNCLSIHDYRKVRVKKIFLMKVMKMRKIMIMN